MEKRKQDENEDEETAVAAIVQDPEAVHAIAVAGGLDGATFMAEIGEFRAEMGARFDEMMARQDNMLALLQHKAEVKDGYALARQDKVRARFWCRRSRCERIETTNPSHPHSSSPTCRTARYASSRSRWTRKKVSRLHRAASAAYTGKGGRTNVGV